MKKITLLLGIVVLMSTTNVYAQGGTTGPLNWKISSDTLIISGNGNMPDYSFPPDSDAPWYSHSSSITTVIIKNGVTSIGEGAFIFFHHLKSVDISNTVMKIGEAAFYNSGLLSIVIPNSVASIGSGAFASMYNSNLTSVILPNRFVEFGVNVFKRCNKLTSITNPNPIPQVISPTVFNDPDGYLPQEFNFSACTLYVPKNSVKAYLRAPVWKDFNIVGIEVGIDDYDEGEGGEQLLIYPNPTTGTCSIVIPEAFQNERFLSLSIYDNTGKLVQQIAIDNENPEYSLKLDSKAAGVYVAVLSDGKRSVRGRIVFN